MKRALPCLMTLLLSACIGDPLLGPKGTISLGPHASTAGAVALEIAATSTTSSAFDPSAPVPGGVALSVPLSQVTFPYSYDLSTIGTTDNPHWRVIVFLSSSEGAPTIAPGAWYGAMDFREGGCGLPFPAGTYCGPEEVDPVLDHTR